MVCTRVGPVVHSTMDTTTDSTRCGVGEVLRGTDTQSHGVIYGFHGLIVADRSQHYIYTTTYALVHAPYSRVHMVYALCMHGVCYLLHGALLLQQHHRVHVHIYHLKVRYHTESTRPLVCIALCSTSLVHTLVHYH